MKKIIIAGKAASGKDWLQRKLVKMGFKPMKQFTTRAVRDIEKGDEYHFISDDEYKRMEFRGEFISSNFYSIGWYGITFDELWDSDVAILSPANIKDVFSKYEGMRENYTIVYLDVPVDVRRKRLSNRYKEHVGDDNERRIKADENDFKDFNDFDIRLVTESEINNFINKLS